MFSVIWPLPKAGVKMELYQGNGDFGQGAFLTDQGQKDEVVDMLLLSEVKCGKGQAASSQISST